MSERRSITILMADDDEDDRVLTADALKQSRLINGFCQEVNCSLFHRGNR